MLSAQQCKLYAAFQTKIKYKFPNNFSAKAKNKPIVSHIQDYGNVLLISPLKYLTISVLLTLVQINVKKFNIESYSREICHQKTLLLHIDY